MAKILAARRSEASHRVTSLQGQFDAIVESCAWGNNNDDEHDPEGATIAFERARVTALLRRACNELTDLDRAAQRLRQGTYGVCERCAGLIGAERMAALPSAATCVACAPRSAGR